MVRIAKALALVIACCAIGCAVASPRVVTLVVPYVPILPLEPTNHRWLGAASCDLQGEPVIWLHPALSDEVRPWVLLHERVHIEQMKAFGGCILFDARIKRDSMFRLHVESEAYCNVLEAQRKTHIVPAPSYGSIVRQLAEDYGFTYEPDSVLAAMTCRG